MNIELNILQIIGLSIFFIINIFAFVYMGIDKAKAINNKRRVPEVHFLFLAIMFCALGILVGILVFRHKIRDICFVIGVPVTLFGNLSI